MQLASARREWLRLNGPKVRWSQCFVGGSLARQLDGASIRWWIEASGYDVHDVALVTDFAVLPLVGLLPRQGIVGTPRSASCAKAISVFGLPARRHGLDGGV